MRQKIKILLAEDDQNLGLILSEYLQSRDYEVSLARDGSQALEMFKKQAFDFCILDVMMPKLDGFSLAQEIRNINEQIPLLFLTAKSMKEDRIKGLKIGADDYLTKPFSMEELLLRVRVILKRTTLKQAHIEKAQNNPIQIGSFSFHPTKQNLTNDKLEVVKLTSKESELLHILAKQQNQVIDRAQALKMIWGDDTYYNSRSMDVYVTKLRKYLKADPSIELINVHGKGFKLTVD